jgi:hypothetical protein
MTSEDSQDIESIRRQYQAMLDKNLGEPAFQKFLAANPTVLADGLPIRVDPRSLYTRGRPGKSEADFVFVKEDGARIEFGVIELKRPGMKILKSPRKLVVTLTNAAATAVAQAREYAVRLQEELIQARRPNQSIDPHPRKYVVMGVAGAQNQALLSGIEERQLLEVFPSDVRIVTYDGLLARFIERTRIRALNDPPARSEAAREYVMLPALRASAGTLRPFALAAPPSLVDAMRRAHVTDVSIYSRSLATASAGECLGVVGLHSDCGLVYLVVATEGLFVLTVLHDRVINIERAESRDEREALGAAGAVEHIFHMGLDPEAEPWLVMSADESPSTDR